MECQGGRSSPVALGDFVGHCAWRTTVGLRRERNEDTVFLAAGPGGLHGVTLGAFDGVGGGAAGDEASALASAVMNECVAASRPGALQAAIVVQRVAELWCVLEAHGVPSHLARQREVWEAFHSRWASGDWDYTMVNVVVADVNVVRRSMERLELPPVFGIDLEEMLRPAGPNDLEQWLKISIAEANRRVCAVGYAKRQKMATTATVAVLVDDRVGVVHVGDSRAYLLRGGVLRQITEDHTIVQGLRRAGHSSAQAEASGWGHALAQALGSSPTIDPGVYIERVQADDVVLLCTDGLHGEVKDERTAEALVAGARSGDPAAACTRLLELVEDAGAPDNASVIVMHVRSAP